MKIKTKNLQGDDISNGRKSARIKSGGAKKGANARIDETKGDDHCGISKEPVENCSSCKVTFKLPAQAVNNALRVSLAGDFNDWNTESTLLQKLENGDFAITIELDAGREYRFRYLIDGDRWENDWGADKYVMSPYGVEDSVVCV